jgi:hypothetical protein
MRNFCVELYKGCLDVWFITDLINMKRFFFLLIYCVLFLPSFAQKAENSKTDSLIRLILPKKQIESTLNIFFYKLDYSNWQPGVKDSLMLIAMEYIDTMMDSLKGYYSRTYNEKEISDLIAFYNTPLGKKFSATSFETSMFVSDYLQKQGPEIQKRVMSFVERNVPAQFKRGNPYERVKPSHLKTFYQSDKLPVKFYYNEDHWKSIPPEDLNKIAEFCLVNKENELYAMVISEKSLLSISQLRQAVLINMQRAADKIDIQGEELRKVNGKEVLSVIVNARVNKLDIQYHWYLYTGAKGVFQFLVWGGNDDCKKNLNQLEDLLNGMVVID